MVKLYACPQGQAAATADALRNEYGVIPGVRVAADERTSQVIVQAPPEVQTRISQRLAAAFPDCSRRPRRPRRARSKSARFRCKQIQADQLEAALWSTLGNRLTALPEQRAAVARLSPGIVQRRDGRDLDRSGDQAGQTGRFRRGSRCGRPLDPGPGFAARLGGPERPADALATGPVGQRPAGGFDHANRQRRRPVALPLAALLMQPRPDAPASGTALPPLPAPSARPAAKPEAAAAPAGPSSAKSRPTSAAFPGS